MRLGKARSASFSLIKSIRIDRSYTAQKQLAIDYRKHATDIITTFLTNFLSARTSSISSDYRLFQSPPIPPTTPIALRALPACPHLFRRDAICPSLQPPHLALVLVICLQRPRHTRLRSLAGPPIAGRNARNPPKSNNAYHLRRETRAG